MRNGREQYRIGIGGVRNRKKGACLQHALPQALLQDECSAIAVRNEARNDRHPSASEQSACCYGDNVYYPATILEEDTSQM